MNKIYLHSYFLGLVQARDPFLSPSSIKEEDDEEEG